MSHDVEFNIDLWTVLLTLLKKGELAPIDVVLFFLRFEGYSLADIAGHTGLSEPAVQEAMRTVRDRLLYDSDIAASLPDFGVEAPPFARSQ